MHKGIGVILKIIAVIPARYGSTRFPGKPLAQICGKPMIFWVYQQAKKVSEFEDVVVATDDNNIIEVCDKFGIKSILTSTTHATGTDRIAEVAEKIHSDWYINVQGDEPLIEPATIRAVFPCKTDREIDVITVKTKITNPLEVVNPNITKAITNNAQRGLFFTRAPVPFPKSSLDYDYYKHLGLYAFSKKALLFFKNTPRGKVEKAEDIEILRFIENGWNVKCLEIKSSSVAVDTPQDLERICDIMSERGLG